jgi:hypothetical protein
MVVVVEDQEEQTGQGVGGCLAALKVSTIAPTVPTVDGFLVRLT